MANPTNYSNLFILPPPLKNKGLQWYFIPPWRNRYNLKMFAQKTPKRQKIQSGRYNTLLTTVMARKKHTTFLNDAFLDSYQTSEWLKNSQTRQKLHPNETNEK